MARNNFVNINDVKFDLLKIIEGLGLRYDMNEDSLEFERYLPVELDGDTNL